MMQAIAGVLGQGTGASEHCTSMLRVLTGLPGRILLSAPRNPWGMVAVGSAPYRQGVRAAPSSPTSPNDCLVVADARLDNRADLLQQLDLPLHVSDEALLVSAWRRWGVGMVDHLLGGFAFACWDAGKQTLFLARDHAGERPLYFAHPGDRPGAFAFASMPPALCVLPWVGDTIDIFRMALSLALIEPENPQTAFRNVQRLLPGHCLTLTPERIEVRRYWHPMDARQIRYKRDDDYIEDFRERLDRAVSDRLAGEGGFAVELSGGLDSSTVAATAARLLAQRGKRLTAFTAVPIAGYDGRALPGRFGDEGPRAAEAAALYPNIDHVRIDSAGRDLVQAAARAAQRTGQATLGPTNQLWLDAILDNVRSRGLDVMLHGVSGNLTISFGGMVGLSDLLVRGRWFTLLRQARELRAGGHVSWRSAAAWATGPVVPLWLRRRFLPEMQNFSLAYSPVHPDRAAEYDLPRRAFAEFYGANESSDAVRRKSYEFFDPGAANGEAAAGWGVEQRDPTQDKRIYEFCFGIPIEQYLVGGQARSLVRRAMQGRLPEATLRNTDRGLQAADWYLVMGAQRERLAAELRRVEQSPLVRHLIDTPRLHALLQSWPDTGYDQLPVYEQWHLALSRGIAAGTFLAQHDPEMPKEAAAPIDSVSEHSSPGKTQRPGIGPGRWCQTRSNA